MLLEIRVKGRLEEEGMSTTKTMTKSPQPIGPSDHSIASADAAAMN